MRTANTRADFVRRAVTLAPLGSLLAVSMALADGGAGTSPEPRAFPRFQSGCTCHPNLVNPATDAATPAAACASVSAPASPVPIMIVTGPMFEYNPAWFETPGAPAACYDRDHPPAPDVMERLERMMSGVAGPFQPRYNLTTRWPGTAGTPVTLTWSFVPDGLTLPSGIGEASAPSNLFAQMDAKFGGNRALWIAQFQACFDRWSALTGTAYVRVTFNGNPWDDGATFNTSPGAAGLRGDIRIGGKNIDNAFGVLAYNQFPTNGDMIIDTTENWGDSTNSYRFLRNTIMHEHGHGIGLLHVCPTAGTILMEPFLNTSFDGPQHDDVRAADRQYGDAFEPNDTAATASNLGSLAPSGVLNPSAVTSPFNNGSLTAISASGDQDWFQINLTAGVNINVTAVPVGLSYASYPQDQACNNAVVNTTSLTYGQLGVEIRASNGTSILGSNTAAAAGGTAALNSIAVPAGTFYVRVFSSIAPAQTQLYNLTISAGAIPVPANDTCASAQAIGFGTITGTTIGSTADGSSTCPGNTNPDVWYTITPPCTGTMIVNTCGSTFDTVLSVHTGCPGSGANQIGCNDDDLSVHCGGIRDSYAQVPVTGGVNYKIRVGQYGSSNGTFTLNVGFVGPANDDCANATTIAAGSVATGYTCGATNDYAGGCGISQGSPDVWFAFTPSCSGSVTINTCGSNYDTVLGLYSGACGSLTELACNDDALSACPSNIYSSTITATVTGGTPYHIRVSGYAGSVGNYTLNVGNVFEPNDLCANAIAVGDGIYTGSTCAAGIDGPNNNCASFGNQAPDVWYTWVAPCTGNLVLNACGSDYDTALMVYTGACGSLTLVGCDDDSAGGPCFGTLQSFLSVPATAGTTYTIRVAGFAAHSGNYRLSVHQQPNDDCADAVAAGLGTTTFSTACATNDGTATCGSSATTPDIWFNHTASCTAPVWIDLCGSQYDTVVSIESGACGSLTELACNDDQGSRCGNLNGLNSFLAVRLVAGTQYKIRVSGFNGNVGSGTMNIKCCLADFNLSGTVDVQDIFDFLSAWFAGDPRTDVNNVGGSNVQDIFDFLAAWFSGCP